MSPREAAAYAAHCSAMAALRSKRDQAVNALHATFLEDHDALVDEFFRARAAIDVEYPTEQGAGS